MGKICPISGAAKDAHREAVDAIRTFYHTALAVSKDAHREIVKELSKQ